MTAIAVALDKDSIILGTDSSVAYGDWIEMDYGPKIYQPAENIWLAEAGWTQRIQVAERIAVELAEQGRAGHSITPFPRRLTDKLAEKFIKPEDEESDQTLQMEIILIYEAAAYFISKDACLIPIKTYIAAGAGGPTCMGALQVLYGQVPLQEAVRRAISAAIAHSPGCGGTPHTILVPRA